MPLLALNWTTVAVFDKACCRESDLTAVGGRASNVDKTENAAFSPPGDTARRDVEPPSWTEC